MANPVGASSILIALRVAAIFCVFVLRHFDIALRVIVRGPSLGGYFLF